MTVTLVYPPSADPTAPYLSVPALTAYLRERGIGVLPIDANLEAWRWMLTPHHLALVNGRVEERLRRLERMPSLDLAGQLAYAALWRAAPLAADAPRHITQALDVMRDGDGRFTHPASYAHAVGSIDQALQAIAAAYWPLDLGFAAYRTPFGLLNMVEVEREAEPDRNPFHDYYVRELLPRLAEADARMVGISIAFPAQIQPAYALALLLKQHLPGTLVVAGGPAITQLLVRLPKDTQVRAVGPFDTVVLFEGEHALTEVVRKAEHGVPPDPIVIGGKGIDLKTLPPPDFDGLPLAGYLSPEPVLPYDPSRGCYWGRCTFCHYGLAERGTAVYRERPADTVVSHLQALSGRWGCRVFHFSHDSLHPDLGARLSALLAESRLDIRWSSDMRPERALTAEACDALARGGALSLALGVESASDRVLRRMSKGIRVEEARAAVTNLAAAGIAAEVMCFTGFPGETLDDAMATVEFVRELRDSIALFIIGTFGIVSGAAVACFPDRFGVITWRVEGDELGLGLFHEERNPLKTETEDCRIDEAIEGLSRGWMLRRYPWSGAISTAHSLLWFARHGPAVFRNSAGLRAAPRLARRDGRPARFDLGMIEAHGAARDAEIWETMTWKHRSVSRELYERLASEKPTLLPRANHGRTLRRRRVQDD